MSDEENEIPALGMWTFLATEVLFFGGLFVAYVIYRTAYPEAFARAGRGLNVTIGTINTAVLLTSSYFMALAVHSIRIGKQNRAVFNLCLTWCLGLTFLLLKAYEYYDDFRKDLLPDSGNQPPLARLFYFIYYSMTGLHALHLTIGLGAIGVITARALRGRYSAERFAPIEVTGLYWHFVDLIWIFLYPLLYLIERHS